MINLTSEKTMKLLDYMNKHCKINKHLEKYGNFLKLTKLNFNILLGNKQYIKLSKIDQLFIQYEEQIQQIEKFCKNYLRQQIFLQLKIKIKNMNKIIQQIYTINKDQKDKQIEVKNQKQISNSDLVSKTSIPISPNNISNNPDLKKELVKFESKKSIDLKQSFQMKRSQAKKFSKKPIINPPPVIINQDQQNFNKAVTSRNSKKTIKENQLEGLSMNYFQI